MLCPYPHLRLGIKQIRMHKWYVDNEPSGILHNLGQKSWTEIVEIDSLDEKSVLSSTEELDNNSDEEEIIYW